MKYKKIIRTKTGFRVTHINRRRACRLMCVECTGWNEAETDRCTGITIDGEVCQLQFFKNMKGQQDARARNEAVRLFCLDCMGGNSHEVGRCKSFYCPLHPYRNTQTDKTTLFAFSLSDEVVLDVGYKKLIRRSSE